jgi:hypothetical protein
MLAAGSGPAFAYACTTPDPAWDAISGTADQVQDADLIEDADKKPVLDQFTPLQQTVQSLLDGTHPLCQDQAALDTDHGKFKEDDAVYQQDEDTYTADCTTVDDDAAKQACDDRRQALEDRKQALLQRQADLLQRAKDLQQQQSDLDHDLSAQAKDFQDAAQVLLTSLPQEAGVLVNAMDRAAQAVDPGNPPNLSPAKAELNCNLFFRAVGRNVPGATAPEWSDQTLLANAIGGRIRANTQDWQAVTDESDVELQKRANRGEVVVGVYVNPHGHGHLAVVTPVPPGLDMSDFPGSGPFVRDGNVHSTKASPTHPKRIAPLGRGAARASYSFSDKQWYVWKPSIP